MAKNIVFCADGTWNGPDMDESDHHMPHYTNVYKLFLLLDGTVTHDSLKAADEQEKIHADAAGNVSQVAKYIHGVGDSRNILVKALGGAFGAGVIARIVRGYTFISRNYQPGDNIFIIGFSRGAYTARALAGFIADQGLLKQSSLKDQEDAYKKGTEAWYKYRKSVHVDFSVRVAEMFADLPAFLSRDSLNDSDFIEVQTSPCDQEGSEGGIFVVGVWDTVGAMGIPIYKKDERVNVFNFTNTSLHKKIKYGFHAISLDEKRRDFTPTLWSERAGIKQLLFAGAHADVGGGYPTVNDESGLSDQALQWMINELGHVGVHISGSADGPDYKAPAHEPWRHTPYLQDTRNFKDPVLGHHSIGDRATGPDVQPDPEEKAVRYTPSNMPQVCAGNPTLCAVCTRPK